MSGAPIRLESGMLRIGEESRPFLAGEIQFWRMDPDTWRPAVDAARDVGITVVSTYLSWRRHEPRAREYDFDGATDPRLDVRRFLQICADAGVHVQLKPGPWICAEEPGGGYPDWLLDRGPLLARDDRGEPVIGYNPPFLHPVPSYANPEYLAEVRAWFTAVWNVIRDLVYPVGPVIALQLDNEPSSCFQDSMYGADYSAAALEAFREWLRGRRPELDAGAADPPRRPTPGAAPVDRERLHDWIRFRTHATAAYLATLRDMHAELGGAELLYTVNLVTHPVHDVPVAHAAVRAATGAAVGEDHYYIPPLAAHDIHRLARSAATARAAGEPVPWIPELQAGIWRSPGEIVRYPDPHPLEQEIWAGAALALGFGGANLYMLVDRENWQHAPLTTTGAHSPFVGVAQDLVELSRLAPTAWETSPTPAAIVAWHRPDAYDAYAVTGTAREPEVSWHAPDSARAYRNWEALLETLTARGLPFELWDTATPLAGWPTVPLLVPAESGVDKGMLAELAAEGRRVILLGDEHDAGVLGDLVRSNPHVASDDGRPAGDTLVTRKEGLDATIVHLVHWGPGILRAQLHLPDASGRLRSPHDGLTIPVVDGRARLDVTPGHRVFVLG
jgi:hypothetical protein